MKKLLFSSLVIAACSCGGIGGGGGGGGSSVNHGGNINLWVERDYLDSGDINRLNIEITDLNPDGAILKFRVSRSLRLVKNSVILFPNREEAREISPSEEASTANERFIVFFLRSREAINREFVSLQFDLKAIEGDEEAFIEVDLDNNDPAVPDRIEFRSSDPRFSALERRELYIEPDASESIVTPTPAATGSASPTASAR